MHRYTPTDALYCSTLVYRQESISFYFALSWGLATTATAKIDQWKLFQKAFVCYKTSLTLCILRVVKPTTSISLPRGCYRFPLACALRKSRLYFLLIPALWHLKKKNNNNRKKNVKEVQFKKKVCLKVQMKGKLNILQLKNWKTIMFLSTAHNVNLSEETAFTFLPYRSRLFSPDKVPLTSQSFHTWNNILSSFIFL